VAKQTERKNKRLTYYEEEALAKKADREAEGVELLRS